MLAPQSLAGSLPFIKFSDEQGLTGNEVITMMQDSYGYLWIGTSVGLSRYDGYQFTNFRHDPDNDNSLSADKIWALFEDADGIIWIGTEFGGLNRYDPATGKFSAYKHNPADPNSISHNYIRKIVAAGEDQLWVATSGGGLNLLDVKTGQFERFVHDPNDERSIVDNFIRALQPDLHGGLWIGTRFNGLDYLNPQRTQFTHYNQQSSPTMPTNMVQALALDEQAGKMWVGTWDAGLSALDLQTKEWQHWQQGSDEQNGNYPKSIVSLTLTQQKQLWIGSVNGGLYVFDPREQEFSNYRYQSHDRHSIAEGAIYSLLSDKDDLVWIGTWGGGLALVNPKAKNFKRIQHQPTNGQSIAPGSVEGIVVDKRDSLWIGIEGGGLAHLKKLSSQFESFRQGPDKDQLSSDDIEVVYQDPIDENILWIGTRFGGVDLFNKSDKKFIRYLDSLPRQLTLSGFDVRAIFRDKENNLWVGSTNGLDIISLTEHTIRRYQPEKNNPASIGGESIRVIFEDSLGYIWIGTNGGGLNRWLGEGQGFKRYQYQQHKSGSLSHNSVWDIIEDERQNLWISTSRGINFFSRDQIDKPQGTFSHYGDDKFVSMLLDENEKIWLSAQAGIYQFDIKTKQFKLYNFIDGALARHSYPAKYRDSHGSFYFGGYDGVTVFKPTELSRLDVQAKVIFTELSLYDRVIKLGDGQEILSDRVEANPDINIPYTVPAFSLKFSTFNYTSEGDVNFRYRLLGFDNSWRQTSHNQLTYTNLDPGEYLLEISAQTKDGDWQKETTRISVYVTTPPWLTVWAYLLYSVLFAALVRFYLTVQKRKLAYKALKEMSLTDQLTGLKNRHFVEQHIQQDIEFSLSHYRQLGEQGNLRIGNKVDLIFYLIDIDRFKVVNDQYGHKAGDRVLVEMKRILEKVFRRSDYIVRWGGEEFLVIARHSKRKHAAKIAERLRYQVASHDFSISQSQQIHVTCSIGFIAFPFAIAHPTELSWENTLELADHCLYAAKKSGRNIWIGMQSLNIVETAFDFHELKLNTAKLVEGKRLCIETSIDKSDQIIWP